MIKKHIHFIGIGGTAMAALAGAFKKAGFKITGSEPNPVYPPVSDYLKKNKIDYYIGFDGKKMGRPDEVVIGNSYMAESNPEIIWAKKNQIALKHYPALAEEYLIKKNSIVISGTYGKTTISSIMTWLLKKARKNPSYMIGGIPLNLKHGAELGDSNWSVIEGDEYPAASPWDYSPKFKYYHPKYLILTSAQWDHLDIYRTKAAYIKAFESLVESVPKNGLIVAKLNGENLSQVLKTAKAKTVFYTLQKPRSRKNPVYSLVSFCRNNNKTSFCLKQGKREIAEFETWLWGDFNLENLTAGLALACELKLPIKTLKKAVADFRPAKRRLEIRYQGKITIIDDFAHSPIKAKAALKAVEARFSRSRIFAIFEPNRGSRNVKTLKTYDYLFKGLFRVFIPALAKYRKKAGLNEVSGPQLVKYLKKTHQNVVYQPDNQKIISSIVSSARQGDAVVFLGSKNFDIVIKKLIKQL